MSIYPVSVKEWYDDPKNAFYKERGILKLILPNQRCYRCRKLMKKIWRRAYVMHSITFGGPSEVWCSLRCLRK